MFNSDIESMINYIQTNHNNININNIITSEIWDELIHLFKNDKNSINTYITNYCCNNNISTTDFIKTFLYYIIEYKEYSLIKMVIYY